MNMMPTHRGGATVGRLQDYDDLAATAVVYLRMWCASPKTQSTVITDLVNTLGSGKGHKAIETFADLCGMCIQHGRRPLVRHDVNCKCVGADEASFAHFIATAAEGQREDAMLIAILLVRPDMAAAVTTLAMHFGFALKQMKLATPRAMAQTSIYQPTLH